jgi:hypothetical protein
MTTNETKQDNTTSLTSYLQQLTAGEVVPRLEKETWEAMIGRISAHRGVSEIDEEAYFWFLEVLPPRIMLGSYFCFAEGMEPFRLFWQHQGRYFVRQLDWTQTKILCRLTKTPVYQ